MKPKALIKMILGILIIGGGMVYLMYQVGKGSLATYLQVSEVLAKAAAPQSPETSAGKTYKVAGHVVAGSIVKNLEKVQVTFSISDKTSEMPVRYTGTVPENFTEDIDVVVTGKLGDEGVFEAKHIMTKCESKYEDKVDK